VVGPLRFEVWLCALDPTVGREISKTRPVVIVSPDEANRAVRWYTVAPMTTGAFAYATRVPVIFDGKAGAIVVDQLRTVDHLRLVRRVGVLDADTQNALLRTLAAYFAP
jgi:mRNA interferase MazF